MVSLAGGRPSVLVEIGQTPDHGLGCGRAFEQMPHLLGGEPSHLADSVPAEELTQGVLRNT